MKRKAVIPVHVWFSVKLFFLFLTFLCGGKKVQPYEYPSFLQCDKRWGADIMNGSISICESGCAMTSLAMYFQGSGIDVPPHQTLDPRSFNAWLRKNEGYVCDRKYKKFCADLNLPKMKYLDKINDEIFLKGNEAFVINDIEKDDIEIFKARGINLTLKEIK